jgi:hypothetical protein
MPLLFSRGQDMDKVYLLWNAPFQGWVAPTGTSTDREIALKFTREEAISRMKRTMDYTGTPTQLPINLADLV